MAGKSLTKRLAALREKQHSITEQIKKIETEQHRQLRKEKQERARIIGIAMLRRMDETDWTEEELFALIDPFIITGKERRFLGLPIADTSNHQSSQHSKTPARSQLSESHQKPPQKVNKAKGLSSAQPTGKNNSSVVKHLPETVSEESLMAEFNL